MIKFAIAFLAAVVAFTNFAKAADMPPMPEPQKEHTWLQQLTGDWDAKVTMYMDPSKPPTVTTGKESNTPVGGFWVLGKNEGTFMDKPYLGYLTLGYDPEKKAFVGFWIDSMSSHMWKYEGSLEGNSLTLNSEGPCPMKPGQMVKFRDVIELKDKDHKVMTSNMLGDDGKWVKVMTVEYTRKK